MFRLFFAFAAVLVCAKEWSHYSGQSEARDVVYTDDGTLWAVFTWGLQERLANKMQNNYTAGSNNLNVADFVQIFALPGSDIIAVSKNGTLVRKNKNSKNFETINNSFVEKKRNVLPGKGKKMGNILILPFDAAIAFFDYAQNRSVITLSQIGTNSLETIERVAVKDDSIWIDLNVAVWKKEIKWSEIYEDRFLADPNSWKKEDKIPFAEPSKPAYAATSLNNFDLQRVRAISSYGNNVIAWGVYDNIDYFARMRNGEFGQRFIANPSDYPSVQLDPPPSALALFPDGSFASGRWGAGLLIFDNGSNMTNWFHSNNTGNTCPTKFANESNDGWTIVQGVVPAPDFSGYIFSYFSEIDYGLGFVDNNRKTKCVKATEASSAVASSIITRKNEAGDTEIYVAWKSSINSREGGIDFYKVPQTSKDFSPVWQKSWQSPYGSPIDFAFDSRGVLWAVSDSKIFYLSQNESIWKEPHIRGFSNAAISALETDAQNGLWIGTLGDGGYLFSQINNSPDSLLAKQFKIKDGLLNEIIYDIAIDTIKGKVFFAHDLGLSVYSSAIVRNASDYMKDNAPKTIAYPNPFRPELHSFVRIDYINEKSSVYILDSSGKRVCFFSGSSLKGGAVLWDGKNEYGKLVAPGLYHYIATDGKNTVKGKILVER
jgi:hypothetical protein